MLEKFSAVRSYSTCIYIYIYIYIYIATPLELAIGLLCAHHLMELNSTSQVSSLVLLESDQRILAPCNET